MFDVPVNILTYRHGRREGILSDELSPLLLHICHSHKEAGRALAFAFIVYDYDDPQVKLMLDEDAYWQALDKIAGSYLTVFAVNSRERFRMQRQQANLREIERLEQTDSQPAALKQRELTILKQRAAEYEVDAINVALKRSSASTTRSRRLSFCFFKRPERPL